MHSANNTNTTQYIKCQNLPWNYFVLEIIVASWESIANYMIFSFCCKHTWKCTKSTLRYSKIADTGSWWINTVHVIEVFFGNDPVFIFQNFKVVVNPSPCRVLSVASASWTQKYCSPQNISTKHSLHIVQIAVMTSC